MDDGRRQALTSAATGVRAAAAGVVLASTGCAAPGARPADTTRGAATAFPRAGAADSAPRGGARGAPTDPAFARHLLNRFGYGPRPGDVERLCERGADDWLDAQLAPAAPEAVPGATAAIPGPHPGTLAEFARLQGLVLRTGVAEAERMQARQDLAELVRRVQSDARSDRLRRALLSERQLEESLVEFWFNHFNVFAGKQTVRVTAGFHEREAIRPHVLGHFRDLLGATARHPAMLDYLDNAQSVSERFRPPPRAVSAAAAVGVALPRGLNENYARELLELHTLGVDGGYSQADVTELARVLTGWSFDRRDPAGPTAFRFYRARHDDAPKRLLGRAVPGVGIEEGEWALDLLARHPATARHVARRLAVAYVSDAPPPELVERLADTFVRTDGDLAVVVRTLATSPGFADPVVRGAKFKTPYHFVVSAVRAVDGRPDDPAPLAGAIARMGMPIHGCPTPDGWRDSREAWLNAEGLRQRIEFAVALGRRTPPTAGRVPVSGGAEALASLPEPVAAALGPSVREVLADTPPRERLAVALASPDFMRR